MYNIYILFFIECVYIYIYTILLYIHTYIIIFIGKSATPQLSQRALLASCPWRRLESHRPLQNIRADQSRPLVVTVGVSHVVRISRYIKIQVGSTSWLYSQSTSKPVEFALLRTVWGAWWCNPSSSSWTSARDPCCSAQASPALSLCSVHRCHRKRILNFFIFNLEEIHFKL